MSGPRRRAARGRRLGCIQELSGEMVVGRPVAADRVCTIGVGRVFTIDVGSIKCVEARIVIIGNEVMRLIANPCLVGVVILI